MTKTKNIQSNEYDYKIDQRSSEVGGGWRLKLYENGVEVGGGVFPLEEYTSSGDEADAEANAYNDALAEAMTWLGTKTPKKIVIKFRFNPMYWRDSYDLQEMIYKWNETYYSIDNSHDKILSVELRRPYVVINLETTDTDNGFHFTMSMPQNLRDIYCQA